MAFVVYTFYPLNMILDPYKEHHFLFCSWNIHSFLCFNRYSKKVINREVASHHTLIWYIPSNFAKGAKIFNVSEAMLCCKSTFKKNDSHFFNNQKHTICMEIFTFRNNMYMLQYYLFMWWHVWQSPHVM